MSHEIRTPLNSIVGLADLLDQEGLDGEKGNHVKTIAQSSELLLNIVNDILDLSKVEAGQLKLDNRDLCLRDELKSVSELFAWQLEEKRIKFSCNVSQDLPDILIGDSERFRQILINLLGNALKFTIDGGVNIDIFPNLNPDWKGNILFQVSDTGIGIEEDKLTHIFEAFNQGEISTTKRFGGTGLGLSITQKLVEMMGGEIWVKSVFGEGSTFYFTLPLPQSNNSLENSSCSTLSSLENSKVDNNFMAKAQLKILVVDDAVNNRNLIKAFLKGSHFEIFEAEDGIEALSILEKETFDLILMDIQMPKLDGFSTTQKFREFEKKHNKVKTPIVALTAYALEQERKKSFKVGCDGHLTKPIKKHVLLDEITQQIQKQVLKTA